ncbi:sensor histidine kinase [Flagellimonas onchidii]|uniref:sensor histidine kinase n=1 Tax=Flagellimonas onchidii TaxID=2562684 RepID=UPI0010A5E84D|nr:histidine kinase [Allomuricauda onchidii]
MKKISLFAFLCLALLQNAIAQKEPDFNLNSEQETVYWNYLVETFVNRGITKYTYPQKYYGDIKIWLINGTPFDSLAAETMVQEVAKLIPNKIFQTNKKEEANLTIELLSPNYRPNEVQGPPSLNGEGGLHRNFSRIENVGGRYNNAITERYFSSIIGDSVPQEDRSKIVQYFVIRGLASAQNFENPWSIFTQGQYQVVRDDLAYNYYDFTERDKFCLSKLYAPDLEDQLKAQVLNEGVWYYLNFYWPEELVLGFKIVIYVLFFLLLIALSYKTILTRKFKIPYMAYLINALLIFLVIIMVACVELYTPVITYFDGNDSPKGDFLFEYFFGSFGLAMIAIVLAMALFFAEKYFVKDSYGLFYKILLKIFFTMLVLILALVILFLKSSRSNPDTLMIVLTVACIAVFAIGRGVFLYFKERSDALLRQKDVELSKLKELKSKAEVASLNARINPHFLYNSLNSIAGLAHNDADKTEKMALSLSDLFRHNINRENRSMTSINDEIEAIKSYLEIEQIRFGERMQYTIFVDESASTLEIPRNIIQPLVENAIKHGFSKIMDKGAIELKVEKNEQGITISVYDNGSDFPEGVVNGYGLQSVHDILELTYKKEAYLNWESLPKKRIWIEITNKGFQSD